ncbi:hotdog fold thioesterase [Meiothermus sp. QL-1]|uniref:hotdog fold thioesterase n=1 Tax=Meiothermus sp. QL-1 TaxID=2058095 RepID=UPI000E0C86B5|nr:hotdog fold thioesterase [Meiothermus sp. QL-1]RDI94818.1 hotdog fold thioesterase [Meiothermus sp. QL-1]
METKSLQLDGESLLKTLGIRILEASPQRVVAEMEVTPKLHQPFGYLHGGASVALAETVASIGAYLGAPEGHTSFGMEINANHLRSVRSGRLTATGTPLHSGRTTAVWNVEIRDEEGRLICISRCTLAITPLR